ncbi:MAG: bis(5'-nucleosyl)-tetraphosphatase (symmetrical) YqeK [Anaerolineae bacterium]|nr:bis(5'-nucleosyl)-tetraphosphatase (symmetrical) YqeK [Anaerolineae bacterium]
MLKTYLPFLQHHLSPPRLQHSLNVMGIMQELAQIYSLNPTQAMTAGLLHDAAKDLSPTQLLNLAEEANFTFNDPCEQHPIYLHAPMGAYFIAGEFGITDSLILDAIRTHSFGPGPTFDTPFSWCLRFADILAPVKEWAGMKKLKNIVYAGRREEAALLQSGWLIQYLQEMDIPVHPHLAATFQGLLARLKVNGSFFERW